MSRSYDPRMHAYDEQSRHAGVLYVLMLVIAVAFGGFLWQLYSAPEIPRITAPPGPYKVEPPPEQPASAPAVAETAPAPVDVSLAQEELPPTAVVDLNPQPETAAMPRFVPNGPYIAQLAALQSEAAVDNAWRRFASRAPDLFANARMDVERADLGARGVYHRVRAGFFADRENASLFCERIRQMGQDCIVAAR
ncbi:MAG: SPOR domain-containing protein [Caulobacteraceae bacterium]